MEIKVKCIAPYRGLRDLLLDVASEDPMLNIDVEVADLEEALPIIKRAEHENYDVIVSRGGTATFIRKHVSIPVVDIPVSGYDILRILTLVKDSNSKLAIIGFPNICEGAMTVSNLIDFEIPIYPINKVSEVRLTLEKAIQEGAQIILGDAVTVKTAEDMGYHGILITSGRESIQDMILEVKHVHDIYLKGHENIRFLQRIVDNNPIGTMICDKKGAIRLLNQSTREIVGEIKEVPSELKYLLKDQTKSETLLLEHVHINHQSYSVKIVPDQDLFIIYLEPNKNLYFSTLEVVKTPEQLTTFAQIIGSSYELNKTIKIAKAYASTDHHIWISGEAGTGKSNFAEAIYHSSNRTNGRFYSVNCHLIDEKKLANDLFGSETKQGLLQVPSPDTLFLQSVELLSASFQLQLVNEIRKGTNIRIISSSRISYKKLLKDQSFNQELLHVIGEHHLVVPPLRERAEDIEEIVRVMIAQYNSKYGKQVVGIREDVLSNLIDYRWPGNLRELKNIVGELLTLTKSHYIELEEWNTVWQRYKEIEERGDSRSIIDLSKTWDEIEKQILEEVLKEEGMNQSKTAKRLGISRATLWRKLQ